MARLAQSFQWSVVAAYAIIFAVAGLITILIWLEHQGPNENFFRLLAVASIIDAAITVLIPVFHWLSRGQVALDSAATPSAITESPEQEIARLRERIAELERQQRWA